MYNTTGHGQPSAAVATDYDPGPVPQVVEPETARVSTIPVTPRTHLELSSRDGCVRLAMVSVQAGARVATDLPPQVVEALVWALEQHAPVPYLIAPLAPWEVSGGA